MISERIRALVASQIPVPPRGDSWASDNLESTERWYHVYEDDQGRSLKVYWDPQQDRFESDFGWTSWRTESQLRRYLKKHGYRFVGVDDF